MHAKAKRPLQGFVPRFISPMWSLTEPSAHEARSTGARQHSEAAKNGLFATLSVAFDNTAIAPRVLLPL